MTRSACVLAAVAAAAVMAVPGYAGPGQPPTTLSLPQCLDLALQQNPDIQKARQELQRTRGLIVEARAPAVPQATISAGYRRIDPDNIDVFPGIPGEPTENQLQPWSATVEISQLVYAGGRVRAAVRAARLTDQIALLDFHRTVSDTILAVRKGFDLVLLDQELVVVREQSLKLIEQQLADVRRRFDAGTVPPFNVLRAEVELANARPPLIRARNDLRLARETLAKLLAIDTPPSQEFTLLNFTGDLRGESRRWDLPSSLEQALQKRPELQQAQRQVDLGNENLQIARAGSRPEVSVFGNYGAHDAVFGRDLDDTAQGWTIGARATWPIFDGFLTRGRITQARARLAQTNLDLEDSRRRIELEVRQAFSDHLQSLELLEAQKKTVEQAEESLRLAEARFRAGTGTQLDVLSAQTALTEARSNQIQAQYDYQVGIASLERVTGATVRFAE